MCLRGHEDVWPWADRGGAVTPHCDFEKWDMPVATVIHYPPRNLLGHLGFAGSSGSDLLPIYDQADWPNQKLSCTSRRSCIPKRETTRVAETYPTTITQESAEDGHRGELAGASSRIHFFWLRRASDVRSPKRPKVCS